MFCKRFVKGSLALRGISRSRGKGFPAFHLEFPRLVGKAIRRLAGFLTAVETTASPCLRGRRHSSVKGLVKFQRFADSLVFAIIYADKIDA